jgi:TonB family protein
MRICIVLAAAALPLQAFAEPPPVPPAPRVVAPATPRANPQSLIGPEDYPASSLRMGERGRVRFALDVGIDGRVHGCTVVRSSGSSALDATTCRLMRSRARFTPARDNNGQPAPGRIEQEVAWTLPGGAPPEPEPGAEQWGYGMKTNSVSAPAIVAVEMPHLFPEPIVALPQNGPGRAELSVWDARSNALTDLGLYESIPACRKVKAQLRLRPDQRAWCTVAPEAEPDLGIH